MIPRTFQLVHYSMISHNYTNVNKLICTNKLINAMQPQKWKSSNFGARGISWDLAISTRRSWCSCLLFEEFPSFLHRILKSFMKEYQKLWIFQILVLHFKIICINFFRLWGKHPTAAWIMTYLCADFKQFIDVTKMLIL